MKSSPESSNNQENVVTESVESADKKRLDFLLEHAERVLTGEFTFGDTLYADLKKEGEKIYEGGDITGADKLKIEELLTELPKAEIRNCLAKAQEFLDNGDQASAKSWQAEVDSRIRSYRNGGLDPKDTSEFLARSKELFSKAYAEKSTQESESSAERQEGDELLTVEEQRGLLKRLLQEKIYGREMSEHKDKNPDLAEQIKKLAENGMLENLSLDLKTGRIHFKYKPKSRSILGFFADYLMNTDKRIAEDRKRLLQGTSMAKFGTGISSKLDKPFGSHAKEARDEFESLREAGIEVEKDGENVSLSFDQESQEGKAAVEALSKMINKKDESESDLEIGNFVQWNSSGASQWEVPRKIEKFSDDGKFAFFEGSATGIPVEQLSVEEKPTKKEDDLDKGKKESPDDKERIEKVRESLGMNKDDFFSRFTKNPDSILSGFKDYPRMERDGVINTAKQSVGAVMDTMRKMYPNSQKRAERLRTIFTQFDEIKRKEKINHPGKDTHAYETFALKRIISTMKKTERDLFNQTIEERFNTKDGKNIRDGETPGVSFAVSSESILADFIDVLGKLGAVEKQK